MDSVDERMLRFVEWHGEIPREARRIEDHEAKTHATPWLRHHLWRGIVKGYVIGFQLEERWWTLIFERDVNSRADGSEQWWIEAYENNGKSWSRQYCYTPEERQWRLGDVREYQIREGT